MLEFSEVTMEEKKNVTFNDLAKYTHFSKTTISRYFNNPDSLTLKNQEIIAQALVDLDYKENKVARILASGNSEFIGILVPDSYSNYYFEILNHILSTYESFGYKFLVFTSNGNADTERSYIQELLAYKVEGLIILSHTLASEELAALPIPIVTVGRESRHVCSVNTDNLQGGAKAAELLQECQCDILVHVNAPTSAELPVYGRIRGFIDYCKENQLKHRMIYGNLGREHDKNVPLLQDIIEDLELNYKTEKKGIFIASDTHSNLFLNLLIRRHGTLPNDYALIGFNDSPVAREGVFSMTTLGQQLDKLAYEAVSLLAMQMNERKKRRPAPLKEPVHQFVAPVLIRRETTDR